MITPPVAQPGKSRPCNVHHDVRHRRDVMQLWGADRHYLERSGQFSAISEPDAVRTLESIPEPFLGRWAGEHHECMHSSTDVDVMYLEPRKVIFWNSFAQVLEVTAINNSHLVLNLEYYESKYSVDENREDGDAAQPLDMTLRLSADQDMLTTIISGRSVHVRHRCPLPAGEAEKAAAHARQLGVAANRES